MIKRLEAELACLVIGRLNGGHAELLLEGVKRTSRWNFPVVDISTVPRDEALGRALEALGIAGSRCTELELIPPSRGTDEPAIVAYFVHAGDGGPESTPRRRWCRPEEARVRIRRKPLRRLIDVAIRRVWLQPSVGTDSPDASDSRVIHDSGVL